MSSQWIHLLEPRWLFSAGDVDHAFGVNGVVVGHVTAKLDTLSTPQSADIAEQHDGRIVVVGSIDGDSGQQMLVTRFNKDGSLDKRFGTDGVEVIGFGAGSSEATSVAIDSRGGIVVGGELDLTPDHSQFAVARLTSSGKLDKSFSRDGKIGFDFGLPRAAIQDLAIAPHDKIVIAGWTAGSTAAQSSRFAVARLTSSGKLDPQFSIDGKQTIDIGPGDDRANALAVQKNGAVVLAGYFTKDNGDTEMAIARLTSAGQLDKTFDDNGIAVSQFGKPARGQSLLVTNSGQYLVAGEIDTFDSFNDPTDYAGVAAFTSGGELDPSFGGDGMMDTSKAAGGITDPAATPVTILPAPGGDDRIVLGAVQEVRIRPDGSPDDNAFQQDFPHSSVNYPIQLGFGGIQRITGFGGVFGRSDGSLVIAGNIISNAFFYYNPITTSDLFKLYRINADGTASSDFAAPSRGTLNIPQTLEDAQVGADGKLVAAGLDPLGDWYARYDASGSIDTSFAENGLLEMGNGTRDQLGTPALTMLGDGGFLGHYASATPDPNGIAINVDHVNSRGQAKDSHAADEETEDGTLTALSRNYFTYAYTSNNTNDTYAFLVKPDGSEATVALPDVVSMTQAFYQAHETRHLYPGGSHGQILAQGDVYYDDNIDPGQHTVNLLARYRSDGKLDSTFGTNGIVFGDVHVLDVQSTGKTIYFASASDDSKGVKRLTAGGAVDTAFGTNGVAGAGFDHFQLDGRGRIIAWNKLSSGEIRIERFTTNGKADRTFGGGDGVVTIRSKVAGSVNVMVTPSDSLVVTSLSRSNLDLRWFATRIKGR